MHCVFDKRIFFNLLIVKWTNFKGRNISENFFKIRFDRMFATYFVKNGVYKP